MTVIKPSLLFVISKFPDSREAIKRLYRENGNFQIICGDYQKCVDAVEYWNRSTRENAPKWAEEYSSLLTELEEEIRDFLGEPH